MSTILNSFPPIADRDSRILILGSMPGVKSLDMDQYYAHPQNLFWPFVSEILGVEPVESYESRKRILVDNHIALWDVLKHCKRKGSLDSDIERDSTEPNDFASFLQECPSVHSILFNGQKAEEEFLRSVLPILQPGILDRLDLYSLPSTSPANASIRREEKFDQWERAVRFSIERESSPGKARIHRSHSGKSVSKTVLFLHGLGCTATSFSTFRDFALPDGCEFLAPTFSGGDVAELEAMAEACLELVRDSEGVHVVGHSMGGAVGLLVAEKLGDRLMSYASLEGNLIDADCGMLSRKLANATFEELKEKRLPRMIQNVNKSSEPGLRFWANQLRTINPRDLHVQARSLVIWSDGGRLLEIFQSLTRPKAYLYGEENSDMEILGRLGENDKRMIPNSGHFLMQDNPRECQAVLAKLWAESLQF